MTERSAEEPDRDSEDAGGDVEAVEAGEEPAKGTMSEEVERAAEREDEAKEG